MDIFKITNKILIEEGKKQTLLDTAKRMFSKGLDISLIRDCTGLSIKELNALAKNLH